MFKYDNNPERIKAALAMKAHYPLALKMVCLANPDLGGKRLDNYARRRALELAGVALPEGKTIAWATPDGWNPRIPKRTS